MKKNLLAMLGLAATLLMTGCGGGDNGGGAADKTATT